MFSNTLDMIKVIATDLDGTLLYPKKPIRLLSSRKRKKMQAFFLYGGRVILVSGRGPVFCKEISRKMDIPCDIVACSGSYIEISGKVIQEKLIPNTIVKSIEELLFSVRKKAGLIITTDDYRLVSKVWDTNLVEKLILRLFRLRNGKYNEDVVISKDEYDNFINQTNRGVMKLVLYLSDFIKGDRYQFAELLKEKYNDLLEIAITKSGMEITPKNIDKGNSIEMVANYLKLNGDEIAVVGDDGNDIPMFRKFQHSFIMAHGYEGAKNEAKYVIKNFSELFEKIEQINQELADKSIAS